jgi:hypothetical protein
MKEACANLLPLVILGGSLWEGRTPEKFAGVEEEPMRGGGTGNKAFWQSSFPSKGLTGCGASGKI